MDFSLVLKLLEYGRKIHFHIETRLKLFFISPLLRVCLIVILQNVFNFFNA